MVTRQTLACLGIAGLVSGIIAINNESIARRIVVATTEVPEAGGCVLIDHSECGYIKDKPSLCQLYFRDTCNGVHEIGEGYKPLFFH